MQVKIPQPLPVAAIAKLLEGKVEGNGGIPISGMAPPEAAAEGDLTFVLYASAAKAAEASGASAVVAPPGVEVPGKTLIRVENPRYALAMVLHKFAPKAHPVAAVHPTAVLAEGIQMGKGVAVGPHAVIEAGVQIGQGSSVGAGCIIEEGVEIGRETTIHPRVTIRWGTHIGSRVEIHPGTVIGSDGFGYVQKGASLGGKTYHRYFQTDEPHFKIPQIGHVIIEDDVEIGANVTVDRGTIGPTIIKKGAKIDNLVQVGHNVVIGEHAIVISQVGLSGGVMVGRHATIGGQAGIAEGSQVGDGALVAAQCGIPPGKKVAPGAAFVGTPGRPAKQFIRQTAAIAILPKAVERLRALEKEIRELKKSFPSKKPG